jgi:hypothetical protein
VCTTARLACALRRIQTIPSYIYQRLSGGLTIFLSGFTILRLFSSSILLAFGPTGINHSLGLETVAPEPTKANQLMKLTSINFCRTRDWGSPNATENIWSIGGWPTYDAKLSRWIFSCHSLALDAISTPKIPI